MLELTGTKAAPALLQTLRTQVPTKAPQLYFYNTDCTNCLTFFSSPDRIPLQILHFFTQKQGRFNQSIITQLIPSLFKINALLPPKLPVPTRYARNYWKSTLMAKAPSYSAPGKLPDQYLQAA